MNIPHDSRPAAIAFFACALVALFSVAMGVPLNHDEHQFVASAALLAEKSLLPYRDFAYFHTPNLVGVYALLFRGTDHLLLAARLFSTLCAWLAGIALFAFAYRRFVDRPQPIRTFFALGITALFFANPVFVYTFPKAWNNTLPALLILLAFLCHCRGAAGRQPFPWLFGGGLLMALAAGTRISFAPLALPFLAAAWFAVPSRRLPAVAACALGMLIGSLPTLLLFAAAPREFLFDNLIYNSRVNAAYRLASGDDRSALPAKAIFVLKVLVNPGNAILFAAFLFLAWRGFRSRILRNDYPFALLLALFPFALIGVLAPTPSYSQYYYVLAILCCAGVACGLSRLPVGTTKFKNPALLLAIAVAVSVASTIYEYRPILRVAIASEWIPMQLHAEGRALRTYLGSGRILTVAPIVALEGGFEIYEPFATGSFASRTAGFLSPEDRRRYGFVSEEDMPGFLSAQPPAAILLGYDKKRETALLAYAQQHQYRRIKLPEKINLWLPPAAAPAN